MLHKYKNFFISNNKNHTEPSNPVLPGLAGGQFAKQKMQSDVDEAELARLDQLAAANAPVPDAHVEQDADPEPDPYQDN